MKNRRIILVLLKTKSLPILIKQLSCNKRSSDTVGGSSGASLHFILRNYYSKIIILK